MRWFAVDVLSPFSMNGGPFSRNVVPSARIFSINLVPKPRMFPVPAIYVLGPLQLSLSARHATERPQTAPNRRSLLKRLEEDALRALSAKLLLELKEARERLNQTSRDSSLPPSWEAPREKTRGMDAPTEQDGDPEPEWGGRLRAFRTRCEATQDHPHAKAHALAVEPPNGWEAVFAVLSNPFWPLTDNEAERALRHWVILRQIGPSTRTPRGSRDFALLASVIDTCRRRTAHGPSPWEYLQTAITRRRQGSALLPLPVQGT